VKGQIIFSKLKRTDFQYNDCSRRFRDKNSSKYL